MVRFITILYIFVAIVRADILDDKIKSFIGANRYYKDYKIINIILGDRAKYIKNDQVDTIKLLKVLKKNGFLNSFLHKNQTVNITFHTTDNALLFLKVINSSLNSMGFNFYTLKKAIKDEEGFTWSINMDTEYLIDPVSLSQELDKRGCKILDVTKDSNSKWNYEISLKNAELPAIKILCDSTYKLKKPIKPYWLSIQNNSKKLSVKSYPLNRWHPYIVFFDNELNILSIFKEKALSKSFTSQIPQNTKYILIKDRYTLNNIRSGLRVYISSE